MGAFTALSVPQETSKVKVRNDCISKSIDDVTWLITETAKRALSTDSIAPRGQQPMIAFVEAIPYAILLVLSTI